MKDGVSRTNCITGVSRAGIRSERSPRWTVSRSSPGRSTHADRLATIRDTFERFGTLIDTHTADGLKVAREYLQPGIPMLVLETALPIKFAATIVEALGREPDRPARFAGIEDLPKRVQLLPADAEQVKRFIAAHCE